jgi:hypothetical protein
LNFPYGEWLIFFITLVTWIEKRASRYFFLKLSAIWLLGKCIESILGYSSSWHWHYARLAVILYVGGYAWQHTQRRLWPLILTSFAMSMETLFLVNDPGVVPFSSWIFAIILVVIAWMTSKSYWGTTLGLTGSVLLDQCLERFAYEGILKHADLPDVFIWNFGVLLLTVWAALRIAWKNYSKREGIPAVDNLVPTSDKGTFETTSDPELK